MAKSAKLGLAPVGAGMLLLQLLLLASGQASSAQAPSNSILKNPILTPWGNSSSAVLGSATVGGSTASAATLEIGPCTFRQMHWHDQWEVLQMSKGPPLYSVMISNTGEVVNGTIGVGNAVLYPAAWPHYQFNPHCTENSTALVVWPTAVQSFNVVGSLAITPRAYTNSAWQAPLPEPRGDWAVEIECAKRCGLKL